MRHLLLLALVACRPSSAPVPTGGIDATIDATKDAMEDAMEDAMTHTDSSIALELARDAGPFEVKFTGERNVWFAVPERKGPKRLIAMLHGVCNPPGYACGHWWPSAIPHGFLVCPEGNAKCASSCTDCRADRKEGPPSWEESFLDIDRDLENSIAKVSDLYPDEIEREGAVLVGFSRGAYVAVFSAQLHPGRWPYLVLNEADTEVTANQLKAAKVKAVVLMAGGIGLNVKPVKKTFDELEKAGFTAKMIVMPNAAHYYSNDIGELMTEAIQFFISRERL